MLDTFGERDIAVVRELTKLHETVFHTTLSGALEHYTENAPRGEFVLIIKGAEPEIQEYTLDDAVKIAQKLVDDGQSTSFASKEAAKITGLKKSDIYKQLLCD
jgi:16S rRNA (cytidine1402-2'-O)-methyltransferase